MRFLLPLLLITSVCMFSAGAVHTEESKFEVSDLLRNRPLELHRLLGRHFSEVICGTSWEQLPIPYDAYRDPDIRYVVFANHEKLRDYMKAWSFMTDNYCVSTNSFFLIFFNKGFVFRVEFRYLPDTFAGRVDSNRPQHCADLAPIFTMIAKELGGSVIVRDNFYELVRFTDKYLMISNAGGGNASLNWYLRGGPRSPAVSPF